MYTSFFLTSSTIIIIKCLEWGPFCREPWGTALVVAWPLVNSLKIEQILITVMKDGWDEPLITSTETTYLVFYNMLK